MKPASFKAILFDLDGTLVDSAPDLAGAGNDMRVSRGLDSLPLSTFRPMVGSGARGMVGIALGKQPGDPEFPALRDEFLARYEQRLTDSTVLFEGMADVIAAMGRAQLPWGIVTNKIARFAEPLADGLGLLSQAAALVCGDTTPHSKPHPAPLLEAARRIGVDAADCLYVGDDLRDVQAATAAGMRSAAAAWGYLGLGEAIEDWGADHLLDRPSDLLKLLLLP